MARPREFDTDVALDSAIEVFAEHGYEGSSAQMLVDAMGIGRQSLYAAFGDKWQLYCAAVHRYGLAECWAHIETLSKGETAFGGIEAMLERVVATAGNACLGVSSTYEFGCSKADLVEIKSRLGQSLQAAIAARVHQAQQDGEIEENIAPDVAAEFLVAQIAAIRMAGRSGANSATLHNLAELALRALR